MRSDEKFIQTTIVVEGSGTFPFDMLRYDQCAPAGEDQSSLLDGHQGKRTVRLRRYDREGRKACAARWASFNWKVIEDSGK